jgi:hypothetical protein
MMAIDEEKRAEVERVLQSEVFRGSDSLRKLLRFLTDRTLAGEAEQLKEYSVGLDAFGKPPDYDPRQDSVVRIQAGRLRQKLSEYYLTDGKDDPIRLEFPKGGYKIHFETRPAPAEPLNSEIVATRLPARPVEAQMNRWTVPVLAAVCLVAVAWAVYGTTELSAERRLASATHTSWTQPLEELWAPFTASTRPLVVAVSSLLFVGIKGHAYYRDVTLNRWEDVLQDQNLKNVRKALGNPDIFPHRSYTGTGDANAMFLLGKLLGTRAQNLSFAKTSDLAWQQFADNNMILVGTPRSFGDLLNGLPADFAMKLDTSGLRVLHPGPGETAFYADQTLQGQRLQAAPEDGEVYALITQAPGPNGNSRVAAFSSNINSGTLAAVQWYSDPVLAKTVFEHLKDKSGHLPPYYQLALRVRFKGGVPTETTYLLHREIRSTVAVASPK